MMCVTPEYTKVCFWKMWICIPRFNVTNNKNPTLKITQKFVIFKFCMLGSQQKSNIFTTVSFININVSNTSGTSMLIFVLFCTTKINKLYHRIIVIIRYYTMQEVATLRIEVNFFFESHILT